jgi:hypothetical protein
MHGSILIGRNREYPIYVTDQPPLPPDGLRTEIVAGQVNLAWGEVLGAGEYRLYRRRKGRPISTGFLPGWHMHSPINRQAVSSNMPCSGEWQR